MRLLSKTHVFVAFSFFALMVSVLAACAPLATTSVTTTKTPAPTGPLWGLPYKAGTTVTLGCLGLHDDNIYADGSYSFGNAKPQGVTEVSSTCPPPLLSAAQDPTHADEASLDLLSAGSGVPVIPLASGTIIVADQRCHFVVVDHGNHTWVAYLHINIQVTVHEAVTPATILGTTAPAPYTSGCENSTAPHVHFAFLTGSGSTGSYISMVGKVLCGYQVIKNANMPFGALQEVGNPQHIIAPGQSFTIPVCPTDRTSATPIPTLPVGTIKMFPIPHANTNGPYIPIGNLVVGPDGNLWFPEINACRIGKITPSGRLTEFRLSAKGCAIALTEGADGNLWFNEPTFSGYIGNISPSGTITEYPGPLCDQFVSGADGNMWCIEAYPGTSIIARITLSGKISEYHIPLNSDLDQIIAGPDGNLWFTGMEENTIGRITPSGAVSLFPILAQNSDQGGNMFGPADIVVGSDGNLWFTETYANAIGRITPSGVVRLYPIPTSGSKPVNIVAGADGATWFTESVGIGRITQAGKITELARSTLINGSMQIVAGPDSNMWFTEMGNNRIGYVTMSGNVVEYPIPTAGSYPENLMVGPDGNLWFVEESSNSQTPSQIGRITA